MFSLPVLAMASLFFAKPLSSPPSMPKVSANLQKSIKDRPIRANYLITAADDFIVSAYLNGKEVDVSKRTMLWERFGATMEQIDVVVRKGDWLVFNVVNNRLRWNGCSYFGVAGCYAKDEFGFVSTRDGAQWSACDNAKDSEKFITKKEWGRNRPVSKPEKDWDFGLTGMKSCAGDHWNGQSVWGSSRNTWIKIVVE